MKKINVAILYGGFSSEREISLKTGTAVYRALSKLPKYSVKLIDLRKESFINQILKLKQEHIDIVFVALHGKFGEDGKLQSLLESLNIKYTGSSSLSSSIAMNKHFTKLILKANNIPTLPWILLNSDNKNNVKQLLKKEKINFPVIVKPCCEGSTIGVSVSTNYSELEKAIKLAFNYDKNIIIEKFITGKEITVPILGNQVLPMIEIIPNLNKFYDYQSKYAPSGSTHIIPPRINKKLCSYIETIALKSMKCIGCEIVCRVDCIVDEKTNSVYVLELNTIPGMTETSLLPESARYAGISFESLVEKIIDLSLKRYEKT